MCILLGLQGCFFSPISYQGDASSAGEETDADTTGPATTDVATGDATTDTSTGEPGAVCGNGVPEGGEECDDGHGNADSNACTASCTFNVCGDGKHGPGEECDDGNLIEGDGCSDNCKGPPEAAVLKLNFSQVKQFDFSWAAVSGATFYRLLERPTPSAAYAQLGAYIVGTSTSRTMPLHLRFGASYILQACNDGGCTDSAPVDVVDSMAAAVGHFKASNTGAGDNFGMRIALSADGNTLAVGAYGEDSAATGIGGNHADNAASDAGAVYVFVRTNNTWSQQAYVKASNTGAVDRFGMSIALSADGNTLAVGAHGEDSAATGIGGNPADNTASNAGAAYVFVRTNNIWSQQAYVKASNTGAGDEFGVSIALSADGNTLAVGAWWEDSAATDIGGNQADDAANDAGAVYVFVRTNNTWSQQTYVKASNTGQLDYFGRRIALSANGNTLAVVADGEGSAATGIGGNQADNTASEAGAVYVFVRTNNIWSQQAYVKASNTGAGDFFGRSLALSADGNTLAVGAWGEDCAATGIGGNQADNAASEAGAVYVFVRTNNIWSQQAYVKASNTGAGDWFGRSIALTADGNTLAIGALYEDSATTGIDGNQADNTVSDAGAVYVFVRTNNTWSQQAYVKASNTGALDYFGTSIALSADGDTLVVGADGEASAAAGIGGNQSDNSADDAGAVYMY